MCVPLSEEIWITRGELAEQWRVPNVYASLDELLANESIDAIIIASSNKHQYALAMTAIEHGLHVLCEKPLAMNYTEAIRMTERQKRQASKRWCPSRIASCPLRATSRN